MSHPQAALLVHGAIELIQAMIESAKKILETQSAKNWIKRFDPEDEPVATFLVRNLRFASNSSIDRGIKSLIKKQACSDENTRPIALFAVREITDDERYFPITPKSESDESDIGKHLNAPDYKSLRPSRVVPGEGVGSEGRMANLIRDITRLYPNKFLDHPGIAEMRLHKCYKILLVDDMLSTSGRLLRFILHLQKKEKTLRSWHSYRWIEIHAVVYSASTKGERNLKEKCRDFLKSVLYQVRPQWGVQWWSEEQKIAVKRLCMKYSKRANIRQFEIGQREGFGTILLESGCTSISPPILWKKTETWTPLLSNRKLPDDIHHALTGREKQRKYIAIEEVKPVENPALTLPVEDFLAGTKAQLLILQAASKRLRNTRNIAVWTGLEISECLDAIRNCQKLKMLDADRKLTALGVEELKRLRRLTRGKLSTSDTKKFLLMEASSFYFPSRLRRARRSSSGTTSK